MHGWDSSFGHQVKEEKMVESDSKDKISKPLASTVWLIKLVELKHIEFKWNEIKPGAYLKS